MSRHIRVDARNIRSRNRFERLAQIDPDIRGRQDDEDVPANIRRQHAFNANRGVYVPRGARGAQQGGRGGGGARNEQMMRGAAAGMQRDAILVWQIKIRQGHIYPIAWVFKQLGARIEDFKPILPQIDNQMNLSFYVKDEEQADSISVLSDRIRHKESSTSLRIWKNQVVAPWRRLRQEDVQLINQALDTRYNEEGRALDLSEFSKIPLFIQNDKLFRLTSNQIMLHVLDRIDERYGHITALSLKMNNLASLDCASMLLWATKYVKVLDLSANEISSMDQVAKLKGLPVEMIFLEGNRLCDEFSRSTDYLSAVHNIFPRVNRLDGIEVAPQQTGTDPNEDAGLEPPYKNSYFSDSDVVVGIVQSFISEYFKIYDAENPLMDRQQLTMAYDKEESMFTLTVQNIADSTGRYKTFQNREVYETYLRQSHNVKQLGKWEAKRAERVHVGAMSIAVALSRLPRTKHREETFTIDISFVSEHLLVFSVSGLFEDAPLATGAALPELKYFQRQFVVMPVPENSSVKVISDMLYISAIHTGRLEKFKQLLERAQKQGSAQPSTSRIAAPPTQPAASEEPTAEIKQAMIVEFSRQSGMKPEWSEKCLLDSGWNYEQAGQLFLENRSKIPSEAFAAAV
ncbi:unnamed protein product, partial [Mesorhabditis spiculigera]